MDDPVNVLDAPWSHGRPIAESVRRVRERIEQLEQWADRVEIEWKSKRNMERRKRDDDAT